ncbi:membrane hypothetical protein [Bradyrhizobium sp. STM 3843]|uniref:prepilin peptidase n=1 Tax=Bradyrhizobium sp. STM 3843 TaxID=551947 RepID=UPI0002403649|nr:prepilin peptidase [Bradyrhizobium sp. STM 3843]CCE07750.1 membrane hypothetical protein [Bradyrhizobium sp. STM 3843]
MSDLASPSDRFNALPLMSRPVGIYFCVLVALTLIALIPGMITFGLLLFILPGQTLIAAPTLLYYSLAALPGYLLARFLGNNLLGATVAVITLVAAALLPHDLSQRQLEKLLASDISKPVPSSFQPRSFELPYPERDNYWMNWRQPESQDPTPPPPCADLCQQLLFKGHIDHVIIRDHNSRNARMINTETNERGPDGAMHRMVHVTWLPRWRRFHLEHRESCPDTLSLIAPEFVHEVVGGRCLIEDTIDHCEADVLVSVSKPLDVRGADGQLRPDLNIAFANVEADPTTITIAEQHDGKAVPAEIRTALHASYANVPFYFTTRRCGGGEIPSLCLTAATEPFANNSADPFEMINRRYGLPVAPGSKPARLSAAPTSEDDRATVNAILKQDYGVGGLIPTTQSKLVASFVNERLKTGQLKQDDIELIRMALKQHAFVAPIETNRLPSETYQALKPLLPDMFERIADRADGQQDMVQSLNVILEHYPPEDTNPYSSTLCQEPKNAGLRVCYQREFRTRKK